VWLLLIALFGLVIPNGFFVYWLVHEYHGLAAVMENRLAIGFILDAFMAMALLAVYFAKSPIGKVRWPVFVGLSLVGGLGFSLPLYWWLNKRAAA
jgi:hypothetical protein